MMSSPSLFLLTGGYEVCSHFVSSLEIYGLDTVSHIWFSTFTYFARCFVCQRSFEHLAALKSGCFVLSGPVVCSVLPSRICHPTPLRAELVCLPEPASPRFGS